MVPHVLLYAALTLLAATLLGDFESSSVDPDHVHG